MRLAVVEAATLRTKCVWDTTHTDTARQTAGQTDRQRDSWDSTVGNTLRMLISQLTKTKNYWFFESHTKCLETNFQFGLFGSLGPVSSSARSNKHSTQYAEFNAFAKVFVFVVVVAGSLFVIRCSLLCFNFVVRYHRLKRPELENTEVRYSCESASK